MTPRKTHSRRHGSHAKSSLSAQVHHNGNYAQNQSHGYHASDYESDAQYLSEPAPPTVVPPTSSRTVDEVNLSVLQRYNPAISAILSKASYAVVYIFDPTTSSWEKSGVEGTLFVCQLQPGPIGEDRFNVIVLNRRGLDNFEAQLLDEGDVEITDEYVILNVKNEESTVDQTQKVYGIWIFCEPPPSSTADARLDNAKKMKECAAYAEHSRHQALSAISQHHLNDTDGASDTRDVRQNHQVDLLQLFKQSATGVQPQSQQNNHQNHYASNGQWPHSNGGGSRQAQQGHPGVQANNNVLADLFRNAGFGST